MKKATIRRIIIKRFRSFSSAVLTFDNPLFVVGRNGAGKSNLADIFSFVSEAMASPLPAVFDRRGGIMAVRNRISQRGYPSNLGLAFEFGPLNSDEGGRFAFEVEPLPKYGYQIVREQCSIHRNGNVHWWFDRTDKWKTNVEGLNPALEPSSLCLPLVGGDERFSPVLRFFGAMRAYKIDPFEICQMQDPDSGIALRSDGGNAASVLQELLRGSGATEIRAQIGQFLETVVPAVKSVMPKKHGNKLSLTFSQEWGSGQSLKFDAFNMSDGTLRTLGLILAVFQKSCPSVLIIEEPEATIHPGALGAVLDLIRRAAKSMQVVVTTHSPELLDAKWIQENNLRVVTWENGASHVLPPSSATRQAMQQHLMGAGELLRSNAMDSEDLSFADANLRGNLFEDLV